MQDILLNTEYDLEIKDGDLKIGFSDLQHHELLLICQKGEFKESPLATVGLVNFLRDNDIDGMLHEVRVRFAGDGMAVDKLLFNEYNGELDYVANYFEPRPNLI